MDEFSINQVKVSILDHLKWSKSSKEADKKRESFNPNDIPYIFERMYEVGDYLATEEARKEAETHEIGMCMEKLEELYTSVLV